LRVVVGPGELPNGDLHHWGRFETILAKGFSQNASFAILFFEDGQSARLELQFFIGLASRKGLALAFGADGEEPLSFEG
jgi:hypothetical protein